MLSLCHLCFKIQVADPKAESTQQRKDSPFPKSSKLSPYLRFGCLSVRHLFHTMSKVYEEVSMKLFLEDFCL